MQRLDEGRAVFEETVSRDPRNGSSSSQKSLVGAGLKKEQLLVLFDEIDHLKEEVDG